METVRSSKPDHQEKAAKQKRKYLKWAFMSMGITFSLSMLINIVSESSIKGSPAWVALLVLFAIILIGVVFDIVGTAVTAAEEAPFHSMASRRVKGATKGIMLLRNAERYRRYAFCKRNGFCFLGRHSGNSLCCCADGWRKGLR